VEYSSVLDVALAAARDAASIHATHLGRVETDAWTAKGVADFVTHVDRAAEAAILARIRSSFPAHAVLAEEEATRDGAPGVVLPDAEWVWIVDPLDGTTNFLHRYPIYAVSIAVVHRGELVAGAVMSGATQETWCALRGGGEFKDGQRIHVSAIDRLDLALIGTGFPFKTVERLPEYLPQFAAVLRQSSGIRRAGSAALDLCYVATGSFDGFWELTLAPWDVAAGALIVREAGGVVTRLDGDTEVLAPGGLLAGNPVIHATLGDLLRDAAAATAPET
jgi:myo-inositol-1(or 4)-monophosphatase